MDVKPPNTRVLLFSYDSSTSRPKRHLLLCVARHDAVTLTWDAPLSKAQGPGLSVSSIEPSGVCLSPFCLSSSRSLGPSLLLGQRSRMNVFSHHIRSLFHQDHRNPHSEFSCHRYNGDPLSSIARLSAANRAEKISKLAVLSDRRPGSLDQLTSKSAISRMGDRSPIRSISGGVLGGDQAQKSSQLTDIFKLSPIPDSGQKLASHNPADPGHRHQILHTLRQFGIVLTEVADLFGRLKDVCLDVKSSPRWRTWSSKKIHSSQTGEWTVRAVKSDGSIVETISFTVDSAVRTVQLYIKSVPGHAGVYRGSSLLGNTKENGFECSSVLEGGKLYANYS